MTVYETLTLMIASAVLVIHIINSGNTKKKPPPLCVGEAVISLIKQS